MLLFLFAARGLNKAAAPVSIQPFGPAGVSARGHTQDRQYCERNETISMEKHDNDAPPDMEPFPTT